MRTKLCLHGFSRKQGSPSFDDKKPFSVPQNPAFTSVMEQEGGSAIIENRMEEGALPY